MSVQNRTEQNGTVNKPFMRSVICVFVLLKDKEGKDVTAKRLKSKYEKLVFV